MTPGQFAGVLTACPALLPAAATTTAPAAVISATASRYAAVQAPSPPRLRFSTRAGFGLAGTPATARPAAQRMPAMMSESNPPHLPSTRTGSTRTLRPTLAMPMPLPVSAAMRPLVCVPCHELSSAASLQSSNGPPACVTSASVSQSPGSEGSASRPSPSLATSTSLIMS